MNKTQSNQVCKILEKNKIELSYDLFTQKIYVNNIKFNNKDVKMQSWFSLIKGKLKINDDNEVLKIVIEIANKIQFNSNEDKLKKKEEEKRLKEEDKLKKKEEEKRLKEEEKRLKEEEKKQIKEREELEKQKKENELNKFIENFDYSLLNGVPKNLWINTIKILLNKQGLDTKPNSYNRIITKYVLKKSLDEKEKYQQLGYILTDDDKIDDSLPVNYEVFFDNFFYKKEEWEALDKTKENDRKYCFYDDWQDLYYYIDGNKNVEMTPERMRTIVRNYSPIKNVYVVNDMYKDWMRENRKDNVLINYLNSINWDGVDRWGINNDSNDINDNENYICKALNIEQSSINKKMIVYSFLHACRQIYWPCRYNFQHVLSFLGDTNAGKTKTLRDMFTFPVGSYYNENLDIANDAEWTIAQKLSNCICVVWNERKGVNKTTNDAIKSFIDLINGTIHYQKKHEQALTPYTSHNICMISYNPKQTPFLSDYSVSYEKRYFILECKQTEEGFKNNYLHFIEQNREQLWAQLVYWCKNNENELNELTEEDINLLKEIQSRNKGINYKDILDQLHFWLNIETYITDNVIDGEQIKNSRDMRTENKPRYNLNFISNSAFSSLLSQINMDSRHISTIDNYKIMEQLGWKRTSKTINKHSYRGYIRNDSSENPILFD